VHEYNSITDSEKVMCAQSKHMHRKRNVQTAIKEISHAL
jgi:hypothetical protein